MSALGDWATLVTEDLGGYGMEIERRTRFWGDYLMGDDEEELFSLSSVRVDVVAVELIG